jgi:hypothetical protein
VARPVTQGGAPISRVQYLRQVPLIRGLFCACLGLCPASAAAGAWVPAPQHGIAIANLVQVKTDQGPPGASLEFYGEYGVKRGWALVVAPSFSKAVQSQSPDWVADEVLIGARRKLMIGQTLAISSQISAFSIPSSDQQAERAYGMETRFALGKSLGKKAWLNLETASRSCSDRGIGSRFDATFGLKLEKDQRLILKAFGDGNGCAEPIIRAQMSYVRPISEKLSIEVGWRQTVSEKSALSDRGVVIGLWRRF